MYNAFQWLTRAESSCNCFFCFCFKGTINPDYAQQLVCTTHITDCGLPLLNCTPSFLLPFTGVPFTQHLHRSGYLLLADLLVLLLLGGDSMSSRQLCSVRKWRLRGDSHRAHNPMLHDAVMYIHTYIRISKHFSQMHLYHRYNG